MFNNQYDIFEEKKYHWLGQCHKLSNILLTGYEPAKQENNEQIDEHKFSGKEV